MMRRLKLGSRGLTLVWTPSPLTHGRWRLGVIAVEKWRERGRRYRRVTVSLRGLARWLAPMVAAAYFAGATALYWIWQGNPYSLLTYTDALGFPLRRGQIIEKQGQAMLAQGADLFQARKFREAAALLRQGLARCPRDLRARLMLAQVLVWSNQRTAALQTLTTGLGREFPGRPFLERLFAIAEEGQDHDLVARVCARYLPRLNPQTMAGTRRWLLEKRFAALAAAGRWEEGLGAARAEPPGDGTREQCVLALLALHRADEALQYLAEWRGCGGANLVVVRRLSIRALREANQFAEMNRAIAEFRGLSPMEPRGAAFALTQQALAGLETEARIALGDYLFRFGSSAANLMLVAEPLAATGHSTLLRGLVEAAQEHGFPLRWFRCLLAQSHLRCGEWDAAAHELESMPPASDPKAARQSPEVEWLARLVAAAQSPAAATQQRLLNILTERPWPVAAFRETSETLGRAGRWETARAVLELARQRYPKCAAVQAEADGIRSILQARSAQATRADGPMEAIRAEPALVRVR